MKTRGMILIALLCVVSVSANAKTVFAIGNSIGVVVDNSVQFYSLDAKNYTSFVRSPNSDFSIPANAKTVFAIGNSIGVVVDNSVQFYSLDAKNYTSFVRSPNSDFSLKM